MAMQSRQALKTHFQNGSIPTAQHFGHLIDSFLNKRDDKFHGKWWPGIEYCEGDVVIWGKTMYMLLKPVDDSGQAPQIKSKSAAPPPAQEDKFTYCSTVCPSDDIKHWCQLQFDFEDKDWKIDMNGKFIYANPEVAHKVGIGINQSTVPNPVPQPPKAKLHVYEEERGEFKFNPDGDKKRVEFRMEAFDQPDCEKPPYLSQWLDKEFAHAESNASRGFTFDFVNENNPDPTSDPSQLMVIIGEKNKPEVGIGTENPVATLQVNDPEKGEFQVNPSDQPDPEIRLTNLQPGQDEACISATVHSDFADLTTNADNGFRFGPKAPPQVEAQIQAKSAGPANGNSDVVAINTEGKMGIGTDAPAERLHVTDQANGEFQSMP